MSKGSPIVQLRIPPFLLAEMDAVMVRSSERRFEGAWTRSSWIVQAIIDRLAKIERGRSRRKRLAGPEAVEADPPAGDQVEHSSCEDSTTDEESADPI